jgi:hypothetical protein
MPERSSHDKSRVHMIAAFSLNLQLLSWKVDGFGNGEGADFVLVFQLFLNFKNISGIIQVTNKCGKAGRAASLLPAERMDCKAAARTE